MQSYCSMGSVQPGNLFESAECSLISWAGLQDGQNWWQLRCEVLDGDYRPLNISSNPGWAQCSDSHQGPR